MLKHVLVGSSDELIFLLMKISLARDPGEPSVYVIKPQDNCKNSRWGRSSPTEGPIQPTGLMTAHSPQCCSLFVTRGMGQINLGT